ncbi:Mob1/phocein [Lentithecium fluviatile CBS 122367]|uniref:Mob1/phocein n=1 Tax=Lentithecium fluviatile CBS 122367 TaxID=1168545 RepID=A0A6G1J1Q9_9PLEO|nr:Mob1/phocein [Lentithecium fluviatile CBS 122367]
MAAPAVSPSSSPRLPSPPPIAEDQLGPKSPLAPTEEQQKLFNTLDHGASRRIRPGTKAEDMAEGPPLVDLSEIDSAFQLTEHLKALHNFLTHPTGTNSTIAIDRDMAHKLAQPPENVDKTLWLYELCRFLTQKVNSLVIALFSDNPPCSSVTCPEMRASEWQYLCAVHEPPKSCCAIDYCCHTLDWAANLLTSPKTFPSRLAMGTDQATQHSQIRHLTNIFRRVYRIFAHAWFQHREMFWKVEGRAGLYIFFKTVCDIYGLISEENYTIPPEAEGEEHSMETALMPPPIILKPERSGPGPQDSDSSSIIEAGEHTLSTAGTTKRHRHSPSVGATSVHTVVEENEEEEGEQEEDPAKEETGAASDQESIVETPETSDEETQEPEQPPINEEAKSADQPEPVASESHAPVETETEKQTSDDAGSAEPHKDDGAETEVIATAGEDGAAPTTEEPTVPEKEAEEEAEEKSQAEEPSPAEPEKAEKDKGEASADLDKDKAAEKE